MSIIKTRKQLDNAVDVLHAEIKELLSEFRAMKESSNVDAFIDAGIILGVESRVRDYRITMSALKAKYRAFENEGRIEHQVLTKVKGKDVKLFGNYYRGEAEKVYKEAKADNSSPVWIHKEVRKN